MGIVVVVDDVENTVVIVVDGIDVDVMSGFLTETVVGDVNFGVWIVVVVPLFDSNHCSISFDVFNDSIDVVNVVFGEVTFGVVIVVDIIVVDVVVDVVIVDDIDVVGGYFVDESVDVIIGVLVDESIHCSKPSIVVVVDVIFDVLIDVVVVVVPLFNSIHGSNPFVDCSHPVIPVDVPLFIAVPLFESIDCSHPVIPLFESI